MSINLLPPNFRPKPLYDKQRLVKVILILLIVFFVTISTVNFYLYKMRLNHRLEDLQASIYNLEPIFIKVQEYERTLETVEFTKNFGQNKELWSYILADLADCLTEDIWFTQITKKEDGVIIEGEASNFTTVGNLAVNIRELQYFQKIDINIAEKLEDQLSVSTGLDLVINKNVKFKITAQLTRKTAFFSSSEGSGIN